MTASAEPRILTEVGGVVVAERGPQVIVVDRNTGSMATFAFVLTVLGLVLGGFGAVTLGLGTAGVAFPVSLGFLFVGIAVAGAAVAVVLRMRRARSTTLHAYRPVAVFDRVQRVFVDEDGVATTLDHVRLQRDVQLTSSSPKLVVVTPHGMRVIARGNPFQGGLGNLETVLTAAVFGPPR